MTMVMMMVAALMAVVVMTIIDVENCQSSLLFGVCITLEV